MKRKIFGVLLILLGIFLGAYLGIWIMFVGGIVGIIKEINPNPNGVNIALSVLKIVFASFVGWLSVALLAVPGIMFLKSK